MATEPSVERARQARVPRAIAGGVALLACVVLAGWLLDLPLLTSGLPGLIPTVPNTALCLLVAALCLWLCVDEHPSRSRRWLVGGLSAAIGLYGVMTLAEYALGRSLESDFWLSRLLGVTPPGPFPGRSSIMTAFACVALWGAFGASRSWRVLSQAAAFVAGAVAYFMLLGYVYDISGLYRLFPSIPMGMPSALAILALSCGVLLLTPRIGLAALMESPGGGGDMLRRNLLPILAVPLLLGWLNLMGRRVTPLAELLGAGFMIMATGVILFALLWRSALYLERLDEKRRDAQEALDDLYQNAPCGYHSLDGNGVIIRINQTELDWLGYSREEMLGSHFTRFLTPAGAEAFGHRDLPILLERGRLENLEYDLVRRDASLLPIHLSATALYDAQGRFIMTRSVLFDRTEQLRLETALRRSEEAWRTILQAAPDGILLVDREGRIRYSNTLAEQVFGFRPGALVGERVEHLVPQRLREGLRASWAEYHLNPTTRSLGTGQELLGLRRDGSEFPVEINLGPVNMLDGPMIVAGIRDISERRAILEQVVRERLQAEQARDLAQLKDHLLSSISHEMKTPLSLVIGYIELLEEKYADEPMLAGASEGAQRLVTHLNRILDVAALLSRRMELYAGWIPLSEIIENVREEMELAMHRAGLELEIELAPDLPPVWGDSRRLTQLLVELLDNARRFTASGGRVGVRTSADAQGVTLTVWDTGRGIPDTQQTLIWEAFSQLDTEDALRTGGLGLGLALAKGIAELHGAHISVTSEPERGSRFEVVFSALPFGETFLEGDDEAPGSGEAEGP